MLERHTRNNFSSGKSNAKDIMIRKRQEQQRLVIIHQNHKSKKISGHYFHQNIQDLMPYPNR